MRERDRDREEEKDRIGKKNWELHYSFHDLIQ